MFLIYICVCVFYCRNINIIGNAAPKSFHLWQLLLQVWVLLLFPKDLNLLKMKISETVSFEIAVLKLPISAKAQNLLTLNT